MTRKEIGRALADARKNKKMTQVEFASEIGSDQQHLSKIETGKTNYTVDTLLKIANASGVSIGFSKIIDEDITKSFDILDRLIGLKEPFYLGRGFINDLSNFKTGIEGLCVLMCNGEGESIGKGKMKLVYNKSGVYKEMFITIEFINFSNPDVLLLFIKDFVDKAKEEIINY